MKHMIRIIHLNRKGKNKMDKLILYVVQNSEGKYFRAKGYGGYGDSWVEDINKARIYTKISNARRTVTFWDTPSNFTRYGQKPTKIYPTPKIIELTVSSMKVVDEKKEKELREQKKKIKQLNEKKSKLYNLKSNLESYEKEAARLEKKIKETMEEINKQIKEGM